MSKIIEPVVNANEVSRISAGTVVRGEISSQSDIRIDGTFEGRIYSRGRVVIGEKALIKGDVICGNVDIWGKMCGNFFVKDTLSLKDSSEVEGDLHIKRLQVELNAFFNGSCTMIDEAEFNQLASSVAPRETAETAQADDTAGLETGTGSDNAL
jgi:cytoskeletal protein CcmA (bactofilin family)